MNKDKASLIDIDRLMHGVWRCGRYNEGMMTVNGVTFPMDRIAEICNRYGAAKLSLFGSILRDDFEAASDVDMLVEFAPTTRIGLIGVARMELELTEAIGRKVDLRSEGDLSRYFRADVVAGARLLHAA
jgi:predicted nucleotidyltransferase